MPDMNSTHNTNIIVQRIDNEWKVTSIYPDAFLLSACDEDFIVALYNLYKKNRNALKDVWWEDHYRITNINYLEKDTRKALLDEIEEGARSCYADVINRTKKEHTTCVVDKNRQTEHPITMILPYEK